jgi:hypothetical protein
MAMDWVACEPLSRSNSLLTGNLQGISRLSARILRQSLYSTESKLVPAKIKLFCTIPNRERELTPTYQGISTP